LKFAKQANRNSFKVFCRKGNTNIKAFNERAERSKMLDYSALYVARATFARGMSALFLPVKYIFVRPLKPSFIRLKNLYIFQSNNVTLDCDLKSLEELICL